MSFLFSATPDSQDDGPVFGRVWSELFCIYARVDKMHPFWGETLLQYFPLDEPRNDKEGCAARFQFSLVREIVAKPPIRLFIAQILYGDIRAMKRNYERNFKVARDRERIEAIWAMMRMQQNRT